MSNVLNTREVLPPIYNSSMGNPPVGPEEDLALIELALNQNIKTEEEQAFENATKALLANKAIPSLKIKNDLSNLDPLGLLLKVLNGKAPSNQLEAEVMAGFREQQLNQR